jgi:hypothetical protein
MSASLPSISIPRPQELLRLLGLPVLVVLALTPHPTFLLPPPPSPHPLPFLVCLPAPLLPFFQELLRLRGLPALVVLNLAGNPLAGGTEDYRLQALYHLRRLKVGLVCGKTEGEGLCCLQHVLREGGWRQGGMAATPLRFQCNSGRVRTSARSFFHTETQLVVDRSAIAL